MRAHACAVIISVLAAGEALPTAHASTPGRTALRALTDGTPGALRLARWEGAQDSKPADELERLSPNQVFREAYDACMQRAQLEASGAVASDARITAATAYLNSIYPVARKQNGGTVPRWMIELSTAHTATECKRAVGPAPASTPPSPAKPRRAKKKKAPTSKGLPEASESLPPWLAPR